MILIENRSSYNVNGSTGLVVDGSPARRRLATKKACRADFGESGLACIINCTARIGAKIRKGRALYCSHGTRIIKNASSKKSVFLDSRGGIDSDVGYEANESAVF